MNQQLEILKKIIQEIIFEESKKTKEGVHLAKLGQLLNKNGVNFKDILQGVRISDFIEAELSDTVEIFSDSTQQSIKLARLKKESEPKPERISIEEYVKIQGGDTQKYQRAIWSALTSKIEENKKRIVYIQPRALYRDISNTEETPNGAYEVDSRYITTDYDTPQEEFSKKVEERLLTWANENKIEYADLVFKGVEKTRHDKIETNLLERLIAAIPEQDLKRVTLPLDIVSKLLKGE